MKECEFSDMLGGHGSAREGVHVWRGGVGWWDNMHSYYSTAKIKENSHYNGGSQSEIIGTAQISGDTLWHNPGFTLKQMTAVWACLTITDADRSIRRNCSVVQ